DKAAAAVALPKADNAATAMWYRDAGSGVGSVKVRVFTVPRGADATEAGEKDGRDAPSGRLYRFGRLSRLKKFREIRYS
ncbi:MAG: hypothetical protein ACR2GA_01125, partial [Chloroflexota bacterium]